MIPQGGVEGKRQVDKVIDKCASMQVFFVNFNTEVYDLIIYKLCSVCLMGFHLR